MKLSKWVLVGIAVSFCIEVIAEPNSENQGYEIAQAVDQRDLGYKDSHSVLSMVLENKQGAQTVRKLDVKVLEGGADGDKSLISFEFPADIKGTSLLTHPHQSASDEQWLYLPVMSRVKRISSRNKSGAFVGSEFSFEDMTNKDLEDYTYNFLHTEVCPALAVLCDKIARFPVDKHSGYTKQHVWIEQQDKKIVRIEYFDRKDTLFKVFTAEDFTLYANKYWRPKVVVMENVQTGKKTSLHYQSIKFSTGLVEQDFRRNALGG